MIEDLEYRTIPEFEEYQINQMGEVIKNGVVVRSVVGHERNKNAIRIRRNDGRYTSISIAKLVALTFLGGPKPPYDAIKYKDGNSTNFALSNIEWATRSEAYREMYNPDNRYRENRLYMLRKKISRPVECYNVVDDEIKIVKQYSSIAEAAADLRVSTGAISRCLRDVNGMCYGMYWRYIDKNNETIEA